jgi:hypothetical protein
LTEANGCDLWHLLALAKKQPSILAKANRRFSFIPLAKANGYSKTGLNLNKYYRTQFLRHYLFRIALLFLVFSLATIKSRRITLSE